MVLPVAHGQYDGCEKQCDSSQLLQGGKRALTLVLRGSMIGISIFFLIIIKPLGYDYIIRSNCI